MFDHRDNFVISAIAAVASGLLVLASCYVVDATDVFLTNMTDRH